MMARLISSLMVLPALLFLSGCAASLPSTVGGACYNKALPVLLDATDLKLLFHDIAAELCVDNCSDCSAESKDGKLATRSCADGAEISQRTVLVTDFADLQSFLPNHSGLLMGELMRGGLNAACCSKIVQAEFAKYFKLSENGLVVLTRQVSEIKKNEYAHPEVVVGTYNYLNNNKVLIFVRRINTETGAISRMVTREIDYTCAGRSVLGYTVK